MSRYHSHAPFVLFTAKGEMHIGLYTWPQSIRAKYPDEASVCVSAHCEWMLFKHRRSGQLHAVAPGVFKVADGAPAAVHSDVCMGHWEGCTSK